MISRTSLSARLHAAFLGGTEQTCDEIACDAGLTPQEAITLLSLESTRLGNLETAMEAMDKFKKWHP